MGGYRKSYLIVSDTHCGSLSGLRTDKWGRKSDEQRYLWRSWMDMCNTIPQVDMLIINGDVVDGSQSRSGGTGLITTDMSEQVEIAVECYESLIKRANKTVRLAGTEYHEGHCGALKMFDEHFGLSPRDTNTDQYVYTEPISSKTQIHIKHTPEFGGAGGQYKGTGMSKEAIASLVAEHSHQRTGLDSTIIVRSHLHSAHIYEDYPTSKKIIQTPCFCGSFRYAISKKVYSWIPSIGYTLLERDNNAYTGYRHNIRLYR